MKKIFIFFIRVYQRVFSPFFPQSCRFYPTCSNYMIEAIQRFGLLKGLMMGLRRISKCHPFHPGGYDPVKEP